MGLFDRDIRIWYFWGIQINTTWEKGISKSSDKNSEEGHNRLKGKYIILSWEIKPIRKYGDSIIILILVPMNKK